MLHALHLTIFFFFIFTLFLTSLLKIFLKKCIIILYKLFQGREKKRGHSPICWLTFQMTIAAGHWPKPKPATGNSVQSPAQVAVLLPLRVPTSRKLELGTGPEPRHFNNGYGYINWSLNA